MLWSSSGQRWLPFFALKKTRAFWSKGRQEYWSQLRALSLLLLSITFSQHCEVLQPLCWLHTYVHTLAVNTHLKDASFTHSQAVLIQHTHPYMRTWSYLLRICAICKCMCLRSSTHCIPSLWVMGSTWNRQQRGACHVEEACPAECITEDFLTEVTNQCLEIPDISAAHYFLHQ